MFRYLDEYYDVGKVKKCINQHNYFVHFQITQTRLTPFIYPLPIIHRIILHVLYTISLQTLNSVLSLYSSPARSFENLFVVMGPLNSS